MQLNAIGLVGILFLINLVQSVGFNFLTATCLVLLSDNETARGTGASSDSQEPTRHQQFRVLRWPAVMYTVNRVVFTSEICLLMVLYRFAFPSTMNKLEVTFGIHQSACSHIVTRGVELISAKFENR